MTPSNTTHPMHTGATLGLLTCLAIGLCLTVAKIAGPQININQHKAMLNLFQDVLPANEFNNNVDQSHFTLPKKMILSSKSLAIRQQDPVYIATLDEVPVALLFNVEALKGYGGAIRLLVALYVDGQVAGVRVIPPHQETPGLGDKIELKKSDWILQFRYTSLENPANWSISQPSSHFDTLTGATITPKAVVDAVYDLLLFYREHKTTLWTIAQTHQVP